MPKNILRKTESPGTGETVYKQSLINTVMINTLSYHAPLSFHARLKLLAVTSSTSSQTYGTLRVVLLPTHVGAVLQCAPLYYY